MKTLFLFLSVFAGFTTFCQTNEQELKNNNWYLDHVVINGSTSTPSVNQEIPFISMDFDSYDRSTTIYCNWLLGHIEIINENFFSYENGGLSHSLQDCDSPSGIMPFEWLYFDFFLKDQTLPFYYEIVTETNGDKTLTITSASGDEAIYGNQQMSVKDVSQISFDLYPNPVKNNFHLQSKSGTKVEEVGIYNLNGKEVLHFKESSVYDISVLQKGVYFVKIKTDQGIMNQKIIKE